MELLIVILLLIIGLLTFLLLKKERVLGIKPETTNKNTEVKIVESKEYRKNIFNLSKKGSLEEAARNLYKTLRKIKKKGFKKIKVVKIPKSKIGIAINDRLKKAAY